MKILITRPRNQSDAFAEQLRARGHEPVEFPVIEIRPLDDLSALDQAIRSLPHYAWVIFTSANAAEIFFDHLPPQLLNCFLPSALQVEEGAPGPAIAAVGPATARVLRARGVEPAFVPEHAVAEAIVPGLGSIAGLRLLLPQATIARPALAQAIRRAGGIPDSISLYQTFPADPGPEALAALASGVDVITFTSPSTIENFVIVARGAGLDARDLPGDPIFACIGPVTRQAAEGMGLARLIMAKEHTAEGLLQAITEIAVLRASFDRERHDA